MVACLRLRGDLQSGDGEPGLLPPAEATARQRLRHHADPPAPDRLGCRPGPRTVCTNAGRFSEVHGPAALRLWQGPFPALLPGHLPRAGHRRPGATLVATEPASRGDP